MKSTLLNKAVEFCNQVLNPIERRENNNLQRNLQTVDRVLRSIPEIDPKYQFRLVDRDRRQGGEQFFSIMENLKSFDNLSTSLSLAMGSWPLVIRPWATTDELSQTNSPVATYLNRDIIEKKNSTRLQLNSIMITGGSVANDREMSSHGADTLKINLDSNLNSMKFPSNISLKSVVYSQGIETFYFIWIHGAYTLGELTVAHLRFQKRITDYVDSNN